jgi:hypothetical protein
VIGVADGAQDLPSGRIHPAVADQVLIGAMISVACRLVQDDDLEIALHLVDRALPLASASTRMSVLKPAARDLLSAAPFRRRPDHAARWARVMMTLRQVLAADALKQALSRVEV